MSDACPFCNLPRERIIFESEWFCVIRDGFPVTELHTLIIPRRHVPSFFDLNDIELSTLPEVIHSQRTGILEQDQSVTGFNIGINDGQDAGQTIFHCHIHLIPRRKEDTPNPRGGVRGVIPNRQTY